MRLGPKIISVVSLILAAFGCWLVATLAADSIEKRSGDGVRIALIEAGHDWADVYTDGLQVHVGGIAPTEAKRFNALHVSGTMVDAARIVDGTTVTPSQPLAPPRFSIEILRNDEGITLIGLVPAELDRAMMVSEITTLSQGSEVTDLLEAASYQVPRGWETAVDFGLTALARLPRSKISISAGEVEIDAIAESEQQKHDLEEALEKRSPNSLDVKYAISAPRPVITPFTLRFLIDETGPHFDACSVDSTRNQARLLKLATEVGVREQPSCTLGLGVPTPEWTNAAILGIHAITELGGGAITFSDADVNLVALDSTPQADFDRVVGELESNLPEVFSLHSVLPEPVEVDGTGEGLGPPEFIATRDLEGKVQLRGRLNNAMVRSTVESFAKARFGVDSVYTAARIDEDLPKQWPVRVLAGLEALAELEYGSAVVQEGYIELRGTTGDQETQADIARLLSEKLGEAQNFKIDVTYDIALDPIAALPTPQECLAKIEAIQAATKISFAPGSVEIEGDAVGVVTDIAEVLKDCKDVDMDIEIAGFTDSQGREQMNQELSQQRADAVLDALVARRILTSRITSNGHGEAEPIGDNETEDGREANRRIEFRMVKDATDTESDAETDEDSSASEGDAATAADEDAATEGLDATSGAAGRSDQTQQDDGSAEAADTTEDTQ